MRARAAAIALAWLVASCTWQPIARRAQPERILEQPARIDHALDINDRNDGRYVLVRVGPSDALVPQIVNTEKRSACALPPGSDPGWDTLDAPNLHGKDVPVLLLPLLQANSDDVAELYFVDEKCQVSPSYGPAQDQPDLLTLRADGRQIALVRRPDEALDLVDPWTGETRAIAKDVKPGSAAQVKTSGGSAKSNDALWLIDGGKLRMRALDGTLLLSLGSDVTSYEQTLVYDKPPLRVAYRDNGDLYEATGPDFSPVLIAQDACSPRYNNDQLDMYVPCAQRQLVRIQLTTAQIVRFDPGVTGQSTLGSLTLEWMVGSNPDQDDIWISTKTTPRMRLSPRPVGSIGLFGDDQIVGRTADGQLGVWGLGIGFVPVFTDVQEINTFRDTRTGRLTWLMLHDADAGTGELAVFEQTDVERALAGTGVPAPQALAEQVPSSDDFGYQVLTLGSVNEPLVLTVEQAMPVEWEQSDDPSEAPTPTRFAGTLHARVLSNALESGIDDGVSSFAAVFAPLSGVLYGVTEGPNVGLWFAAL